MAVHPEVVLLADDVRALAGSGAARVILGIAGAPGSGKSTLSDLLIEALAPDAVLVGMDGFHLAAAELERLGRTARKGAPDTFDVHGYVALLRRLRARDEPVVYTPRFDRALEEPIGSAIPVRQNVPIVITEGNYLLLDEPGWRDVPTVLDACWFVEPPEALRLERLVARHVSYGRTPDQARDRSHGSDQRNARLIAGTRARADRIVSPPPLVLD